MNKGSGRKRSWSKKEDRAILAKKRPSDETLASLLSRSKPAIHQRRWVLNQKRLQVA